MPITPLTLFHSALSGLYARQFDLDLIADNLANLNTVGFKPSRADFQELVVPDSPDDEFVVPYRGVSPGFTRRSLSQGALLPGASPLDLAIEGDGFFAVQLPGGGTAYTRDGRFTQDTDGKLVTTAGYPVVWQGALPADAAALHVNPDGTVMARIGEEWQQVGTIGLTRFANPTGLVGRGDNLLVASEDSGDPQAGSPGANGFGRLISGAVEGSATDTAAEMSHMIIAQRAYSLSLKAFQQADQMIGLAIQLRSR